MSSWSVLLRAEAGQLWQRRHTVALLVALALGPLDALVLPRFPASIERFFSAIFQLEGWTEVILVNDYLAIYAVLFWLGLFDALRALVVPTEEGYLELWLSKPLSRRRYLVAKLLPVFVTIGLVGAAAGAVHGLSAAAVGPFDVTAFAAGVAATIALAAALLAVVSLLTLWLRESYHVIVIGFVLWAVSLLPGSIAMYRPDVLTSRLRGVIAFPMNLVWAEDSAPVWLASAAGVALVVATIAAAGALLEQRDEA